MNIYIFITLKTFPHMLNEIKFYICINLKADCKCISRKSIIIFIHLVVFTSIVLVLFSSTSSLYFNKKTKYLFKNRGELLFQ